MQMSDYGMKMNLHHNRTDHDEPEHEDTVHDVKFNWFGDMMATCASDHKVLIYKRDGDSWSVVYEIPAHVSPVWRLSWAHPDFGNLLATCSMDHKAKIWRMTDDKKEWISQGNGITDSSTHLTDIAFAPRVWSEDLQGAAEGLKLAVSSDEHVWLYFISVEKSTITWTQATSEKISVSEGNKISCISWGYTFRNLVLAVGMTGSAGHNCVALYQLAESSIPTASACKWIDLPTIQLSCKLNHMAFRPTNGSRDNYLAIGTENKLQVYRINEERQEALGTKAVESFTHDQIKHVTWDIFGKTIITLSEQGTVRFWKWRCQTRKWESEEIVSSSSLQAYHTNSYTGSMYSL